MKADIYMPFFTGDYLKDTLHLKTTQHGAYILILLDYWSKRRPPPDDDEYLSSVTKLTLTEWLTHRLTLSAFFEIGGGVWKHKRVEVELTKALAKRNAQSKGGKKGAEAKKQGEPQANPPSNPQGNLTNPPSNLPANPQGKLDSNPGSEGQLRHPYSYSESISLERERGNAERPSLEEVKIEAQRIGLAEWKAVDWFNEMEGCGWLDHAHRPIVAWRPVLTRVRAKWEADGRPTQPPSRIQPQGGHAAAAPSVWQLTKQIEAVDAQIAELKNNGGYEDAHGWHANNAETRQQMKTLRQRKRDLQNQLATHET